MTASGVIHSGDGGRNGCSATTTTIFGVDELSTGGLACSVFAHETLKTIIPTAKILIISLFIIVLFFTPKQMIP